MDKPTILALRAIVQALEADPAKVVARLNEAIDRCERPGTASLLEELRDGIARDGGVPIRAPTGGD
jgi:hypothetical protein